MIDDRLRGRLRDNALTDEDAKMLLLHVADLQEEVKSLSNYNDALQKRVNTYRKAFDDLLALYTDLKREMED